MTYFFIVVAIISTLFLILNFLFAPHNPYQEKYSIFECGFHSFLGQNRTEFTITFFIFAIVYLILDLEIVMLYPYANSAYENNIYGLCIVLIFIVIITIGFVYELGKNALRIDSKQYKLNYIEKIKYKNNDIISNIDIVEKDIYVINKNFNEKK
jgi:NADH-ubiquinone oxidoreductase chain 3